MQTQPMTFRDPSLPPVPPPDAWLRESPYCRCERPLKRERAERRGAARTYCARCGLEVPVRMSS